MFLSGCVPGLVGRVWRASHLSRPRVACVPASRRPVLGDLRSGLRNVSRSPLRCLTGGCLGRGSSRALPGGRVGAGRRRHQFSARTTVIAAGAEDQHDRYQCGRCQYPQRQQRGPLEAQVSAHPARAGARPGGAETPESRPRACRDRFPVRHLVVRGQPGEHGQQCGQFRVRSGEPALDRVQGLLLPCAKPHGRDLCCLIARGRVTAPQPGRDLISEIRRETQHNIRPPPACA